MGGLEEVLVSQLSNQFAAGGMLVVAFGAILALLRKVPGYLGKWLLRTCVTTIDVSDHDPAYFWIQSWLGDHPYTKDKAKLLTVSTRTKPVTDGWREEKSTTLIFSPAPGYHLLWVSGRPVLLSRERKESENQTGLVAYRETFVFRALNKKAVCDLIFKARESALDTGDDKVSVFRHISWRWKLSKKISPRAVDSVILSNNTMTDLITDLKKFFLSKDKYESLGIPYQRGYMLEGPPGGGKCLGKGTPVLMFDGSIQKVEDIREGDLLMGDDSTPRKVLSLVRGEGELYKVTPVKGDSYIVNKDHILSLKMSTNAGWCKKNEIVDISVADYINKSAYFKSKAKGFRVGVEFPHKKCEIDPYFLGIWLGDGTASVTNVTTADPEVVDYLKDYAKSLNLELKLAANCGKANTYSITSKKSSGVRTNILRTYLKYYNLFNNKHIPNVFKTGCRSDRLQLLAGIIDSDGHNGNNTCDYVTKDRQLADDIIYLSRSLGFAAYQKPCVKGYTKADGSKFIGNYYRISISGDLSVIPNKVPHKKFSKRLQKKDVLRTGIQIESVGIGEYFGFEIDGNKRFLLGDFTVTHNSSTAISLAGNFKRDIYVINLSSTTDDAITEALSEVPEGSFLLVEDVDCAFVEREAKDESNKLTFSGLLNAIDGIASKGGRVLFMTTNHPEKIDEALTRPGRADKRIVFDYASKEQATLLYLRFFPGDEQGASKFAELADGSTSMATLQEHLIRKM